MNEIERENLRRYILGELPPAEMASADARVLADVDFAQAVTETRLLLELAHAARTEEAQAAAQSALERQQLRRLRRVKRGRMLFAVAASLALLLTGYIVLRPASGKAIFKEEFVAAPGLQRTLGTQEDAAYIQYDSGHYAQALALLRNIPAPDDTAQFFMAQCLLALDSADAALHSLQRLQHQIPPDNYLYLESNWYIALCYLSLNRTEEAQGALKMLLSQPDASHKADALRVLKRID